jgi:hypothetical protein
VSYAQVSSCIMLGQSRHFAFRREICTESCIWTTQRTPTACGNSDRKKQGTYHTAVRPISRSIKRRSLPRMGAPPHESATASQALCTAPPPHRHTATSLKYEYNQDKKCQAAEILFLRVPPRHTAKPERSMFSYRHIYTVPLVDFRVIGSGSPTHIITTNLSNQNS